MTDNQKHQLTRRRFLQLTGSASAVAVLAACAPATAPAGGGEAGTDAVAGGESMASGGTMIWVGHQEVSGLSPNDAGPTVQWAGITTGMTLLP